MPSDQFYGLPSSQAERHLFRHTVSAVKCICQTKTEQLEKCDNKMSQLVLQQAVPAELVLILGGEEARGVGWEVLCRRVRAGG